MLQAPKGIFFFLVFKTVSFIDFFLLIAVQYFYWSVVFLGQAYFQQKLYWGLSPSLGTSIKMVAPGQ